MCTRFHQHGGILLQCKLVLKEIGAFYASILSVYMQNS